MTTAEDKLRVGPLTMRRSQRRAAGFEQRLHGLKLGLVDDRRHRHFNDFFVELTFAGLPEFGVEAVAAASAVSKAVATGPTCTGHNRAASWPSSDIQTTGTRQ